MELWRRSPGGADRAERENHVAELLADQPERIDQTAIPEHAPDTRRSVDGAAGELGGRPRGAEQRRRRRRVATSSLTYGRNEDGGLTFEVDGEVTMQPGPQWQLSISPAYERQVDTQQYVTTLAGGGPATFGSRYVFRARRSLDLLDADPPDLHVQAGSDARLLRRAVCRQRPVRPRRRAGGGAHAAASRVRHRGHDADAPGRRQSAGHRRRDELSRCRTATSTSSPSAATSCCAGSGAPAARCTWCGSRIGSCGGDAA